MTIRCSWCGRLMGEKCPQCGSSDVTLLEDGQGIFYLCQQTGCGIRFPRGAGGLTHSLCSNCQAEGTLEQETQNFTARLGRSSTDSVKMSGRA